MLACLLAGAPLMLAAPCARAQEADSLAIPLVRAASAPRLRGDRSASRDSARANAWHEQPRFVMARSLLVPGWGQLHNGAWIKALVAAGSEGWLGALVVQDQRELNRLLAEIDVARAGSQQAREVLLVNQYNARLDQRLSRQWQLAAVLGYAMVDAYVDAHFRGFDLEFLDDPALPPGSSPAGAPKSGGGPGVRLSLRWDF